MNSISKNTNMEHAFNVARKVCNLPKSLDEFWKINSAYPSFEDPQLILIHTNDRYDPERVSHAPLRRIRGIIIDVKREIIVVHSTGHEVVLTVDTPLRFNEEDESIELDTIISKPGSNDRYIQTHGTMKFSKKNVYIRPGFEGAILRVFKWNGVIFVATFKTLFGREASLPGRSTFYELYTKYGGPDVEELYKTKAESCPMIHHFLICADELRSVSSITNNFVINSILSMCDELNKECPCSEYNSDHGVLPVANTKITVDIANKYLFPAEFVEPKFIDPSIAPGELRLISKNTDGIITDVVFNPTGQEDKRLKGGDFVMIFDDETCTYYKIESAAYTFRRSALFGNINFYNQFIKTINFFVSSDPAYIMKNNKFPYPPIKGKAKRGNKMENLPLITRQEKYAYVKALYKLILSPVLRHEVDGWMKKYEEDIKNLSHFFATVDPTPEFKEEFKKVFQTQTFEIWSELRKDFTYRSPRVDKESVMERNIREALLNGRGIAISPILQQYRLYMKRLEGRKIKSPLPSEAN